MKWAPDNWNRFRGSVSGSFFTSLILSQKSLFISSYVRYIAHHVRGVQCTIVPMRNVRGVSKILIHVMANTAMHVYMEYCLTDFHTIYNCNCLSDWSSVLLASPSCRFFFHFVCVVSVLMFLFWMRLSIRPTMSLRHFRSGLEKLVAVDVFVRWWCALTTQSVTRRCFFYFVLLNPFAWDCFYFCVAVRT